MSTPPGQKAVRSQPGAARRLFQQIIRKRHLPDYFLTVVSLGAFALAVTFLAQPELVADVPSFSAAFSFAPPWAWALLLVVNAVWVAVSIFLDRRASFVPCQALAILLVVFAVCSAFTPVGGIPSIVVICMMVGFFTSLSGLLAHGWRSLERVAHEE